jgi:V/A-type H+/Na+-transporting ATPase subunit D
VTTPRPLLATTGRAGRLRLRRRIATASRASDLLTRKLRILRREQERLDLLVERTDEDWLRACASADLWILRAGVLGGQRALRLATGTTAATVRLEWAMTMGIRYPVTAAVIPADGSALMDGTAALHEARRAYRRALEAAVRHATATAARQIVGLEAAMTRTRLRAIDDRTIPRLRETLSLLELTLDELEHADAARLRRAAPAAGWPGTSR